MEVTRKVAHWQIIYFSVLWGLLVHPMPWHWFIPGRPSLKKSELGIWFSDWKSAKPASHVEAVKAVITGGDIMVCSTPACELVASWVVISGSVEGEVWGLVMGKGGGAGADGCHQDNALFTIERAVLCFVCFLFPCTSLVMWTFIWCGFSTRQ